MKIIFSNGLAQVVYSGSTIKGNIYLSQGVLDALKERGWFDKEFLDNLDFDIPPLSSTSNFPRWRIFSIVKLNHKIFNQLPSPVAHLYPEITGDIKPQGKDWVCIY